jgi:hypothetical protein
MKRVFVIAFLLIFLKNVNAQTVANCDKNMQTLPTTFMKTFSLRTDIRLPQIAPHSKPLEISNLLTKNNIKSFSGYIFTGSSNTNAGYFDKRLSNGLDLVADFQEFKPLLYVAVLDGVDHLPVLKTEGYDKMSLDLTK